MSSGGDEAGQTFATFWMPGSPAAPIVGNPVTPSDLAALNDTVTSVHQANLTTMTNAVPQDDFPQNTVLSSAQHDTPSFTTDQPPLTTVVQADTLVPHLQQIHVRLADTDQQQLQVQMQQQMQQQHMHQQPQQLLQQAMVDTKFYKCEPSTAAADTAISRQLHGHQHVQLQQLSTGRLQPTNNRQQQQPQQIVEQKHYTGSILLPEGLTREPQQNMTTQRAVPQQITSDLQSQNTNIQVTSSLQPTNSNLQHVSISGVVTLDSFTFAETPTTPNVNRSTAIQPAFKPSKKEAKASVSAKPPLRRRLSASHREMIINLVFNEKKTSREVGRYMGLPQSTVMSVIQVFKKENRIHKKTATGRKRRLTTHQEFQLFEMSQERENVPVDEIKERFLQNYPDFGHISKTTIYRTLERGKKGLIGMDVNNMQVFEPVARYIAPQKALRAKPARTNRTSGASDTAYNRSGTSSDYRSSGSTDTVYTPGAIIRSNVLDMDNTDVATILLQSADATDEGDMVTMAMETPPTSTIIAQETRVVTDQEGRTSPREGVNMITKPKTEPGKQSNKLNKELKQRRSLSIKEREMIISLFFNEHRTVREVADFLHLAKSTVSSVVQVFRKERRIQRKCSPGRKRKLSSLHEQRILDMLAEKDNITIEETRSKFLALNPEVSNISKSTIYRIMENCQSKMKSRQDMQVFVGTLVNTSEQTPMEVRENMVVGVVRGKIEFIEGLEELEQLRAEYGFGAQAVTRLSSSQFLMPGLIDTHTHAPQFPNNGLAMDVPLLEWLQTYTFPIEAGLSDITTAAQLYNTVVRRLLKLGTTTATYFATIHLDATKTLVDAVVEYGQRALVGKVNMLTNCPDYYRESSLQDSLAETENLIEYIRALPSAQSCPGGQTPGPTSPPLVLPIITPRFAPTCPEEQMSALAQLASKHECHIQTHLSETLPEISWVKELFPWAKSYTHVYDVVGLLTCRTVVAHVVHTSPEELRLLAQRGTGVAHCPSSNTSLRSGLCDVRLLHTHGVKVGLGSDCSGGPSPSLLEVMRRAVDVSNCLAIKRSEEGDTCYQPLNMQEAFHMATLGGAKVLNMEDKIGSFEVEKQFDALLIDINVDATPIDTYPHDTIDTKVMRFLYHGDDRNIVGVYVSGRKVGPPGPGASTIGH